MSDNYTDRALEEAQAEAWRAVFDQLLKHNPKFCVSNDSGKNDALAEIRRLQALDRPARDSAEDLRDAALELLAAFSITSQEARERAILRMWNALKGAGREGQS